ncbi:MAG: hypothetical protein IJZ06_09275 [Bacteroidales bacterium]|nr:hypothetical protein [Bacteroidales bacterium]
MKRIYFIMTLLAMMMVSCVPEVDKATVETKEVTDITINSARVVCNIADDGGSEVSLRGVCWDTSENPTIETASSMEAGSGIGNYECDIDGLEPNTTYYVRAYATNSAGVSYSEDKSFMTSSGDGGNDGGDDNGEIDGHEYVDLGLPSGLKWATCNVGADSPECCGDYFAWGETCSKTEYTEENSVTYGQQIGDFSGNALYDAATANWGGIWRMPTNKEINELMICCEWEWIQVNGVNGIKGVGLNGNSIFLPASGYYVGTSLYDYGDSGHCWSSTPNIDDDHENEDRYAYTLYFNIDYQRVSYGYRFSGVTVRPVAE